MISIDEMMNIIATEAVESIEYMGVDFSSRPPRESSEPLLMNYNLRLVKEPDGKLVWKDD